MTRKPLPGRPFSEDEIEGIEFYNDLHESNREAFEAIMNHIVYTVLDEDAPYTTEEEEDAVCDEYNESFRGFDFILLFGKLALVSTEFRQDVIRVLKIIRSRKSAA